MNRSYTFVKRYPLEGLGGRIKQLREALDMTQAELATAIGGKTTNSRVSDWEREEVEPERGTIAMIALAARARFDYDAVFAWLQEGGEMPPQSVYGGIRGSGGVVHEIEVVGGGALPLGPGDSPPHPSVFRAYASIPRISAAHSQETSIRLQLFRDAMLRLAESGPTVDITLATQLLQEMQAAWAIAEAKRSAASGGTGEADQQAG